MVLADSKFKISCFIFGTNLISISGNILLSHILASLVVSSYIILKGRNVFFFLTLTCRHYWTLGLLEGCLNGW